MKMDPAMILALVQNAMQSAKLAVPRCLYHYTSFEVWNLLTSGNADLCCTEFHELNDSREYRFGLQQVVELLKRCWEKDEDNQEAIEKADRIYRQFINLSGMYELSPWVFSLTQENDSLNQWISYTDKQAGGVAIGFERIKLESELNRYSTSKRNKGVKCWCYLAPCLYVGENGEVLIDRKEVNICGLFEGILNAHGGVKNAIGFQNTILLLASMIKHNSFEKENEWRVIIQYDNPIVLQDVDIIGGKLRIPFVKRNTAEMHGLIHEVVVAPHADKTVARRSVLMPRLKSDNWCYHVFQSKLSYK